jgi:hypothetical protein
LPFSIGSESGDDEQRFKIIEFKESTNMLEAYKHNGAFVLRAPGLSEIYWDHAVVVTAVVESLVMNKNWEKEIRQILYCLDGDDLGNDPRTNSVRKAAEKKGKLLSDLNVKEADAHGAHLQRVRMIDSKLLGSHSDSLRRAHIEVPYAAFQLVGGGRLTDEQLQKLGEKAGKVYNTYAVEKEFGP